MFYTEVAERLRVDRNVVLLSQFDCSDLAWWSLLSTGAINTGLKRKASKRKVSLFLVICIYIINSVMVISVGMTGDGAVLAHVCLRVVAVVPCQMSSERHPRSCRPVEWTAVLSDQFSSNFNRSRHGKFSRLAIYVRDSWYFDPRKRESSSLSIPHPPWRSVKFISLYEEHPRVLFLVILRSLKTMMEWYWRERWITRGSLPVLVQTYQPQISYELATNRNWVSAIRGRWWSSSCTVIPRLTKIIRSGITFVSRNVISRSFL